MTNQVLRCNRAVMSAELGSCRSISSGPWSQHASFIWFQRTLHEARTSSGRITLLTRKIPWWHQSSYLRLPFLLPRGRTGIKDTRTPGSLGCWQVALEKSMYSTAPAPGSGKVSFTASFVLRLLVESRGAAPPRSSLGNSVTTGLRQELWRAPQGIKYFADTEEDSPYSQGLKPIS